ncbi:Synaptic vesicle glycoprotein 2B [Pseudolycoriella hygida]|uniref:Synaptic vesicle glycoprotein 2B n=1 Tax=Pseudolycoriella hygida TaxID=35572 RepID=A0A9Q0MPZ9_9DIPT|nr:Synaptic vesicle glycoprotein 2B [Pseudolycoriella hygida]
MGKVSITFEDAVTFVGNGKFHFYLLFATGFCLLGANMEGLNMAFVLPAAKCDIQMTTTEQGLINAIAFIGFVLTSQLWGFVVDTYGRLKVLQFSLLSGFIFSIISSFSVSSMMLLFTRLLVGMCTSGSQASAITYLSEFHSNANRAQSLTFASMFLPMSILYQPLLGLAIMTTEFRLSLFGFIYTPWRLYILVSSLINVVAFLMLLYTPESPKFLLAMGEPDKSLKILARVYEINGYGEKENFPVKEISQDTIGSNLATARGVKDVLKMIWKQTTPLFRTPFLGSMLMLSYISFVVYAVANGVYMWYPQMLELYYENFNSPITMCEAIDLASTSSEINKLIVLYVNQWTFMEYFNFRTDVSTSTICKINSNPMTFQVIIILGSTFLILYCFVALNLKRIQTKVLYTVWLFISFLATIGNIFGNEFYLNTFLMIVMLSCVNCGNILCAVASDLFPTHYKGMALSLIIMFARLGAVTGGNVVGALLFKQCNAIFYSIAAILLIATGISYIIMTKVDSIMAR